MATDQEQKPSQIGLEVFMSKLLNIVSDLCLISDGFFVDRFENDVYPILAELLGDFLPGRHKLYSNAKYDQLSYTSNIANVRVSEQKNSTLPYLLHCIKCTFESSCGIGLAGLIPSLGTMLLPFLSLNGQTGEAVIDALKAMLRVDCDALWRGLQRLHSGPFPRNPMKCGIQLQEVVSKQMTVASYKHCKDDPNILIMQRAGEILGFIESLPEQQIF